MSEFNSLAELLKHLEKFPSQTHVAEELRKIEITVIIKVSKEKILHQQV